MKILKGLVGLLGAGAVALGMSGNVIADRIDIGFNNGGINKSSLRIAHTGGASEDYDSYDAIFLLAFEPALDIYSKTSYTYPESSDKLKTDARPPESYTTINSEILGRGLSSPNDNELKFSITDPLGENNFMSKNIYADLYNSAHIILGTYDVKDYAANGTTIPITVNNGPLPSYFLDIRFTFIPEPSTGDLLIVAGIAGAGIGAYYALRSREKE